MADIGTAYTTTLEPNCDIKFDIVTIGDQNYLGVVTLSSMSQSYKYRVFPGENTSFNNYNNVIEGTISNTNNHSFTFPIQSIQIDYFVIVTPTSIPSNTPNIASNTPEGVVPQNIRDLSESSRFFNWSAPMKETFAIFYPKRILKERKRRLTSQTKSTAPEETKETKSNDKDAKPLFVF